VTRAVGVRSGVLLTVAYDGAPFSGWAKQRSARTVAGELEGAIRAMDPGASEVRGTSRTDAGVHARGQLAAFDTDRDIEPRGWALGLARQLPDEVGILSAAPVTAGFDPRGHVVSKLYRYLVLRGRTRDPHHVGRSWRVGNRLNQELMQQEALLLVGQHDFRAFRGAADTRSDTVRTILRAEVRSARSDGRCLQIEVEGDRFLYHMVRIIAGTLVDVGRGRLAPGAVKRALESGARADLGLTAPAEGLYLQRVTLDQTPTGAWPSD
jgi:tRNA pseudouridine38-40 synthase